MRASLSLLSEQDAFLGLLASFLCIRGLPWNICVHSDLEPNRPLVWYANSRRSRCQPPLEYRHLVPIQRLKINIAKIHRVGQFKNTLVHSSGFPTFQDKLMPQLKS